MVKQTETPLFLGQLSPLQPCGTVLYLYTSIPKKQIQLCIIPQNQNKATHESFGLKGLSVVKAIAELPLIGDLSLLRRVRVGDYFRCDET
jgi:hypothetical protein